MKGLGKLFGRKPPVDTDRSSVEHQSLGDDALRRGELKIAIDHYRLAIESQPDSESLHFSLGNALALSGDPRGAADHLREAIRCNPDFAAAFCNLGLALHDLG